VILVVACFVVLGVWLGLPQLLNKNAENRALANAKATLSAAEESPPPPQNLGATPAPSSTPDPYALMREYLEKRYGRDIEWWYKMDVAAYEYCKTLPDSEIKSYALKEGESGIYGDPKKYIRWSLVKITYDRQMEAYQFIRAVEWDWKPAIKDCTRNGYTDWIKVERMYDNRKK
jgi:hypothetical protein